MTLFCRRLDISVLGPTLNPYLYMMDQKANDDMRINGRRARILTENIHSVKQRIEKVADGRKVHTPPSPSKPSLTSHQLTSLLQPPTGPPHSRLQTQTRKDILFLHDSPHRHRDFGENYAQELTEKAALLPPTIQWHMIGALQTNKCKPLAEQVANLYCVSSVDTVKKADALEKGRAVLAGRLGEEGEGARLRVLVQVNTSGEEEKSGVQPGEAVGLCRHVREKCPHLVLAGLMTIGALARSREASAGEGVNEDFVVLRETRDRVAEELKVEKGELELSMGMSSDFEGAIGLGSDEVRVGTTIFGERPARKDAKIKDDGTEEEEEEEK